LDELKLVAPQVGFPVTICALFFGEHPYLAHRFLDSLFCCTDPAAFRLRCGLNAVGHRTHELIESARRRFRNVRVYESRRNLGKCPMMRQMFHEPRIATRWTFWFDDDSFVTRSDWLLSWALAVEAQPETGVLGSIRYVTASPRIQRFIKSAAWYRGKALATDPVSGAARLEFVVGGFWAVRTRLLYQLDWPDPRLIHYEDDYIFGEALRQRGVVTTSFDAGVVISAAPRRGSVFGPRLHFPR
jgi:GT2 family glycosyltransferase